MTFASRLRAWLKSPDALPLAAVALVGLVFFGPGLLGEWPAMRDWPGFTLPSRFAWREAVLAGRLPEWNPHIGLGLAMTGAPVHGVFYPGHLLLLLGSVVRTLPVLFALHATLTGVGAYALARSVRCGRLASSVAAVSWMLGGYAVSMWGNGEKVLSGAWIPLAAAGLVFYIQAPSFRSPRGALAALAFALMALAGDPFLWLDTLALAVPLAWAVARDETTRGAAAGRVAGRVAIVVGLALLVASPSLLPAWLLREDTQRAGDLAASAAELWSLHPARLLELVAPGALGDPQHLAKYPGVAFADDPKIAVFPWALSIYAGAACASLPFVAGKSRTTAALAFSAVLGLFAAFGRHTPIHAALRAIVFPMRWMRYPEKHALVVVGALALLAALGCDRVLSRAVAPWKPLAVFAALGVVALIAAPADVRSFVETGLFHATIATACLAAAIAITTRDPRGAVLVFAVVVVDTWIAASPLIPWGHETLAKEPPDIVKILAKPSAVPPRLLRPRRGFMNLDTLPGNMASLWGIDELPGHDPARSVRLDEIATHLGSRHTFTLARILRLDWALEGENEKPDGDVTWNLYEFTHLPRAWMVGNATVADDDGAYARMDSDAFDPQQEATLATPSAPLASFANGSCSLLGYAPEKVAFDCDSSGDALVVASEADAKGWTATVDGTPAPIERADVVLRGVRVSRGTHRLVFAYATPGLRAGMGLGGLGVLGCMSLGMRMRRRGRKKRRRA